MIVGHPVLDTIFMMSCGRGPAVNQAPGSPLLHVNIKCIPAADSSLSAAESNQRLRGCRSDLRAF